MTPLASGAVVSYVGTEPATTTFSVRRPATGRLQGGRCAPPSQANLGHKHCTRYVAVGSFKHRDRAGTNQFRFTGRVHGHKLSSGSYRLSAVPHNSGGAGRAVFVSFSVKSG